jgi:TonB family protein
MFDTKMFSKNCSFQLLALVALIASLSLGVDAKAQTAPPVVDHDNSKPSAKDGTVRAGVGGVSTPGCVSCPPPKYSSEARAAKLQGTVVLQATVTADGRAINISVVKALGKGLEEKAIEAVKNWKFKPANGPDGKPVPCVVPIEVTFRLRS